MVRAKAPSPLRFVGAAQETGVHDSSSASAAIAQGEYSPGIPSSYLAFHGVRNFRILP